MTDTPIFIEKREQSDQICAIETALLCGILTAGISFSIFSVVEAGREQQFMVLAFSETAILILSIVNLLLSPRGISGSFSRLPQASSPRSPSDHSGCLMG